MRAAGNLVLVGAREPVAFFAYPDKPSLLMPKDARSTKLAGLEDDMEAALEALAIELGAMSTAPAGVAAPRRPASDRRHHAGGDCLHPGAMLPENAIVVDESVTTGREFFPETAGAPPHDWINNRGGSIGYGMPSPSAPPSPAPTARSSRWWATAAPCTRCRRCGPWRGRAWTSRC